MRVSDIELEAMIARLEAMGVTFHALPGGKGIYLGDGQPYRAGQALRSKSLARVVRECLVWRKRFAGELVYDAEADAIGTIR